MRLSSQATVYAVRDGQVLTLRRGSNGSACKDDEQARDDSRGLTTRYYYQHSSRV
jgi:hypothetical protein